MDKPEREKPTTLTSKENHAIFTKKGKQKCEEE